jgi:hypothetical protein
VVDLDRVEKNANSHDTRPTMHRSLLPLCLCSFSFACAHASGGVRGEEVIERGGELADARAERATVTVTADTITVWGLVEVPDGSRMQAAFAGVDAITRSELLKAVQVRVAEVVTDMDSTDPSRRSITMETMEVVDGVLARGGPLPHGWARIRRGDTVVIRLWARLDLPRAGLENAVRSLLASRGKTYEPALLDGLTLPAATDGAQP